MPKAQLDVRKPIDDIPVSHQDIVIFSEILPPEPVRFVIVLAALHCLAFIDRTMIGGVLPLLRASVSMSDAQAGWIVGTAFALPYGATALTVAVFRRARPASTRWLIGGVLVWTAGSALTGLANTLATLAAARALLGIGQGIFVPFAIARLLDSAEPAARGRALGLFVSGATLGRSTALLTVGALLSVLALVLPADRIEPWRWLFVITALPNLVVVIAMALSSGPAPVPAIVGPATSSVPWRTLMPFFPVAVAPVVLGQAVFAWLPTVFVRERGLATADAALLIGAVTLVAAPAGPIIAGRLISRYKAWERHIPWLVLTALIATLVPLAGMIVAPGLIATVASMIVMLIMLGMASFGGLFGVQLLIPPDARVTVNGIFLAFVTVVGVGLGPLLTGVIASVAQRRDGSLGHALLTTGGLAATACALAVIGARGSFRRDLLP